jgi:hypothetical protein
MILLVSGLPQYQGTELVYLIFPSGARQPFQSRRNWTVDVKFSFMEGNVTAKDLSSRNRRKKEDRIEKSQPFRERILSVQDKIRPERESMLPRSKCGWPALASLMHQCPEVKQRPAWLVSE